jgi:phenylalanyl-tRNA synthetase alpha subunit
MVDEGISLADMKGVLALFLSRLLGRSVEVRLRPHYFPYSEVASEEDNDERSLVSEEDDKSAVEAWTD